MRMFMGTRKAMRRKLAKSEGYLLLAVSAQRWADEIDGKVTAKPFEEWGDDDVFVTLARKYGLTKEDLGKLFTTIAQECENKAMALGYERAWVEEPKPSLRTVTA